jgi:hypothetical protein
MRNIIILSIFVLITQSLISQPIDSIKNPIIRKYEHKLWEGKYNLTRLNLLINQHRGFDVDPTNLIQIAFQYTDSCKDALNELRKIYFRNKDSANLTRVVDLQVNVMQIRNQLKRIQDKSKKD